LCTRLSSETSRGRSTEQTSFLLRGMALCIWTALGRCTAQPGDAQEQCQTCAADFHSVCATSGVRALFQGNEALQDVSAHCCGRCGQWERPADPGEVALAAEPQAMEAAASAEAPEESLICDPTKLEVVTHGRYPSMDLVRCCVPSCGHATSMAQQYGAAVWRSSIPYAIHMHTLIQILYVHRRGLCGRKTTYYS
jgi:hypothetical protein